MKAKWAAIGIPRRHCAWRGAAPAFLLALILTLLAPGGPPARADTWVRRCLDCPRNVYGVTQRSLKVDAAGQPHVAYGGDGLTYARRDGVGWHLEAVDSIPDVTSVSLALDPAEQPHIAYYDPENDILMYASRDEMSAMWQREIVHWGGEFASLVIDAQGYAHIAYQSAYDASLYYAYQDESGWHTEAGPWEADHPEGISLALDANGHPHVSYRHWDYDTLHYAYKDGAGWHDEFVFSYMYGDTSLVLDRQGRPHITYFTGSGLAHAYRDPPDPWQFEDVDTLSTQGVIGEVSSLVLDGAGQLHVSYEVVTPEAHEVRVATRNSFSQTWERMVAVAGVTADATSLAIDAHRNAHVFYMDYDGKDPWYAAELGGAEEWLVEKIEEAGMVGVWSSQAVDASNHSHVAYFADRQLKYAVQDGAGWQIQAIDGPGNYNSISLALDEAETPHVVYSDYIVYVGQPVRYAVLTATGWQTETIDSEGTNGSLVLDAAGQPHVSYCGSDGLRYGVRQAASGTWQLEVAAGGCAARTSLVLDAGGGPHIVYYDSDDINPNEFRHAYKDQSGWHSESIGVMTDYGSSLYQTSLALDASGYLHASFCLSGSLNYAYQDAGGWHKELVDDEGGAFNSMALDAAGRPHIAYYRIPGHDLYYAFRDAAGWHLQAADPGEVGPIPSIALDGSGLPRITYCDDVRTDLRYAFFLETDNAAYLPLVLDHGPAGANGRGR